MFYAIQITALYIRHSTVLHLLLYTVFFLNQRCKQAVTIERLNPCEPQPLMWQHLEVGPTEGNLF